MERWQSGRMRRFAKPLYGLTPVPRVQIPPSPPDSLDYREFPTFIPQKFANFGHFSRFLPAKPDCRERTASQRLALIRPFSLHWRSAVRLSTTHEANTERSQTEGVAKADLTFVAQSYARLSVLQRLTADYPTKR